MGLVFPLLLCLFCIGVFVSVISCYSCFGSGLYTASSVCLLLMLFCYTLGEFIHLSVVFFISRISTFRQGSLYFRVRVLFAIFEADLSLFSYFYREFSLLRYCFCFVGIIFVITFVPLFLAQQ